MSDKKSWAVFVQPSSNINKNFNHNDLIKAMTGHMAARGAEILAEFEKSGMADQIDILSSIPALHMISVKATDAAIEKLKTMNSVVHSVESNVFTSPMPEEDRTLLEQRRQQGAKPKPPGPKL